MQHGRTEKNKKNYSLGHPSADTLPDTQHRKSRKLHDSKAVQDLENIGTHEWNRSDMDEKTTTLK